MPDRKKLNLKIAHFILIIAALIMCFVALVSKSSMSELPGGSAMGSFAFIVIILALISGLVYLVNDFKKEVASFYKIYMVLYLASVALSIIVIMASKTVLLYEAFIYIISIILATILVTVKDLGKTKTYIVAGILLACCIFEIIKDLVSITGFGMFAHDFSLLLLSGTATIMVIEKYIDKTERGTK